MSLFSQHLLNNAQLSVQLLVDLQLLIYEQMTELEVDGLVPRDLASLCNGTGTPFSRFRASVAGRNENIRDTNTEEERDSERDSEREWEKDQKVSNIFDSEREWEKDQKVSNIFASL